VGGSLQGNLHDLTTGDQGKLLTVELITAAGVLLGLGALMRFALVGPFMGRVRAFAVMVPGGLMALGAQSAGQPQGWERFAVLAVPGVLISIALIVLAVWLSRELLRLSGETDPDGGEGRHD